MVNGCSGREACSLTEEITSASNETMNKKVCTNIAIVVSSFCNVSTVRVLHVRFNRSRLQDDDTGYTVAMGVVFGDCKFF